MKRIRIIVTALLVLAALTHCKKEEQVSSASEGNTVDITVNIKGNGGSRVDINTGTGTVTYESGDKIYVVSGGRYVGTLTHNSTCFDGTITDPSVGEPLYFYFFGNVTPAETLVTGVTTTCSVDISDQTEHLPVIECAPSIENYVSGSTTFTAMLLNQCALVKFNVTTSSEAATCITGMKNKVAVDFSANTMTHSQEGNGVITLPAGSGERWAILLPQEAVEAGTLGSAYSEDGAYTGTHGAIPAIADNGYLTTGIEVVVNTEVNSGNVPTGAIGGKFTINENGDQVYFSQGNLQYIGSATTPYWKFAENQWDYFGTTTGQNSSNPNVDRDLFGWGTSGYDHGAVCYQPYSISSGYYDYNAYGGGLNSLYDQTGQADWGYNAIINGGNQENFGWRTLSTGEWYYIYSGRTTPSGMRYAKANVNNVNGLILLPDDWDASYYPLNEVNHSSNGIAHFNSNVISITTWIYIFQSHGAVFLPAAGVGNGNSVGDEGHYWSSTCQTYGMAYDFELKNYIVFGHYSQRCNRHSVRLVCPVQ